VALPAESLLGYISADPFADTSAFPSWLVSDVTPALDTRVGLDFSGGGGGAGVEYEFSKRWDNFKWDTRLGQALASGSYLSARYTIAVASSFDLVLSSHFLSGSGSADGTTRYTEKHVQGSIDRYCDLKVAWDELTLHVNVMLVNHATPWQYNTLRVNARVDERDPMTSQIVVTSMISPLGIVYQPVYLLVEGNVRETTWTALFRDIADQICEREKTTLQAKR
jgi:hypothetical protein